VLAGQKSAFAVLSFALMLSSVELPASAETVDLKLPSIYEADKSIVERHPREAKAIAANGAAVDAKGLVGRNRQYGRMVSPRLQLGAGAALRIGLHANLEVAQNGFLAIEVATKEIGPDGEVKSSTPPDAPQGAKLTAEDAASGAAFFLADACPAVLSLEASGESEKIAAAERVANVRSAIARATTWLTAQSEKLMRIDRGAPNRLLYDALAYHSCGVLSSNEDARALAQIFVAKALEQTRPDGIFVEKGGSDTNYQAVAVRLALDLLLTGYNERDASDLREAWRLGSVWLSKRIMPDGRIHSSGNTRTCAGGESFLGSKKKVAPVGIYSALIYPAEINDDNDLKSAAARLSAWAQANPKTDPCFEASP
jgi:hypothetical protein